MIQSDFIKKIENYLDENYDLESRETFDEREKFLTLFEKIKKFFKKFFGSSDKYFFDYQSKELHKNKKRDVIIEFFIENKIDDVSLLNEILEYYHLRALNGEKIFSDEVKNLIEPIDDYINKNYVRDIKFSVSGDISASEVEEIVLQLERKFERNPKIFSDYLFNLIREKNLSEVEVYKKAHLDRRIFSKLRNEKDYMPSKRTILAIAFGMKLNLEETEELLKHGGYALSVDLKFDLIMKYFFENEIYDLFLINEVLDYYGFNPICY